MFDDLSKESNALLVSMYKRYLELRKVGEPRFNARYFGDVETVKIATGIRLSNDDVSDIVYWLRECGYVVCREADGYMDYISITEKTIALCERRFVNGLKAVLDALSDLKDFFL